MIADIELEPGDDELDAAALYSQVVVDKAQLSRHIRQALQDRSQITLRELSRCSRCSMAWQNWSTYLQLGQRRVQSVVDEEVARSTSFGVMLKGWMAQEYAETGASAARNICEVRMAGQELEYARSNK